MEKFNIAAMLNAFSDKSTRKGILKEETLDIGLLHYTPGQTTPDHMHSDIDEIFYVISGEGKITINTEPFDLKEKDIIYSPHGETHGFHNISSSNLIVLQIKKSISSLEL